MKPAAKAHVTLVAERVAEAAVAQPKVHVRLMDGKRILTGAPGLLAMDDKPERSFTAYLDTGASGCLLGAETAKRFGVPLREDAQYHEVGLDGDVTVGVSKPLTLQLADSSGSPDEPPPAEFRLSRGEASLQISRDAPKGLMAMLGDLNVIGMPAISRLVVEIAPPATRERQAIEDAILAAGPSVVLHDRNFKIPKCEFVVPLEFKDFNQRKHPANRGALPDLASNPLVPAVTAESRGRSSKGDWLLDTGAAASIVSRRQAIALGLLNADGTPAREADFSLPLGGIGDAGEAPKASPGYVIDRLVINAQRGQAIEFRNVPVVIRDVGFRDAAGKEVILDGVFGMNLLLPAVSGMGAGRPGAIQPSPFSRVWIDGPRGTLGLQRR